MRRYPLYHFLFWLTLIFSLGLLFFIILFFSKIFPHLIMGLTSVLVAFKLGNQGHLLSEKDFYLNSLFLILSLIFSISFFLSFGKIINLKIKTGKFIQKHLKERKNISFKLQKVLTEIKLNKVNEVKSQNLEIFCFGFLNPQICISSSLVKLLSRQELKAVLIHEGTHLSNYDPLRILILKTLENFFFYTFGLKTLVKKFLVTAEILADFGAIQYFQTKKYLLKALIKILEKSQNLNLNYPETVGAFNVTEERINWLTEDRNYHLPLKKTFLKYAFSFSAVMMVLIFLSFSLSLINCGHPFKCLTAVAQAAPEEENFPRLHEVIDEGTDCNLDNYYNFKGYPPDVGLDSP